MTRFAALGLAALLAAGAGVAATPAPAHAPRPAPAKGQPALPHAIPTRFDQLRFFVQAKAPGGATLDLITDTAGGTNLSTLGATKLGLPFTMPADPRRAAAGSAPWPRFAGAWIPAPRAESGKVEVPILVPPRGVVIDGMLGARWFADRTWEWDYRAGTLRMLPKGALPKLAPAHVLDMRFKKDTKDGQATGFARIPARVEGTDLQFLFDTGATFRLGKKAAEQLGDAGVRERAGSFIAINVLKGWRERHPDWPFIEGGDSGAPMIRVPDIEIAGWHTGPVWFSARPDRAFDEYLAEVIDKPVSGALGGNAFATFRITADYPSGKLAFEQVSPPARSR